MLNLRDQALKSFLFERMEELFPCGIKEEVTIVAIAFHDAITRIQEDKALAVHQREEQIDRILKLMMEKRLVWLRKEYNLNFRIATAQKLEKTGRCFGAKVI